MGPPFSKAITSEWHFNCWRNMLFTLWDNIAWLIGWILLFEHCQIYQWWPSWKICYNHYILISPKKNQMWRRIILPQSPKIGLLISTMVWKHLFFVWLITITQLTFLIHWLGLTNMHARLFLKHPSCKWKFNVLLQLTCSSISWINVFFDFELMNALGIMYPQFWMRPNVDFFSPFHLAIIKNIILKQRRWKLHCCRL
jgi:hypothetical protein